MQSGGEGGVKESFNCSGKFSYAVKRIATQIKISRKSLSSRTSYTPACKLMVEVKKKRRKKFCQNCKAVKPANLIIGGNISKLLPYF